jgi:hypothetical protein
MAAPAPALVAVPSVDDDLGPLGDVDVAAIRAGQSEQVRHVDTMSGFSCPVYWRHKLEKRTCNQTPR